MRDETGNTDDDLNHDVTLLSLSLPLLLVQEYHRNGVVGPIDILPPQQAQEALQAFERWERSFPNNGQVTGNARFKPHLYVPFCHVLAHNAKLVHIVQRLLQTKNVLLWSSDFNIKPPNTLTYYAPHQDATYAGLDPSDKVLTVWVALSEKVSPYEGCMEFWNGSQLLGQLPHQEAEEGKDDCNMLSRGQRLVMNASDDRFAKTKATPIALRGGQATIHNFYTVHSSGPNQSPTTPRIGLALRYMAATVRPCAGKAVRESVTLIAGQTVHDGFDLEPRLSNSDDDKNAAITPSDIARGRRAHAVAMQREAQNYFQGSLASSQDGGATYKR